MNLKFRYYTFFMYDVLLWISIDVLDALVLFFNLSMALVVLFNDFVCKSLLFGAVFLQNFVRLFFNGRARLGKNTSAIVHTPMSTIFEIFMRILLVFYGFIDIKCGAIVIIMAYNAYYIWLKAQIIIASHVQYHMIHCYYIQHHAGYCT